MCAGWRPPAYVVFDIGSSTNVDLAALADRGFRIDGAAESDFAAGAVAGAGDVNGDGREDVLVGARRADNNGRPNSGSGYVVYGFGEPELAYDPLVATAGRTIAPHAPRLVRHTGPPRFSVSRPLPPGLRLDPKTGVVSGTPSFFVPRTMYPVTMSDLAGSARAALTVTVIDARAPRLKLSGPVVQRVLRQKGVDVRASCDEPCRLSAAGTVTVSGMGAVTALRRVRAAPKADVTTTLRLRLSSAGLRRLARLLDQGKRARATVSVRAVDRAGNASSAKRKIVLRS